MDEFRAWLDRHEEFSERAVVTELKRRIDLCLLIQLAIGMGPPNRYKFEPGIQGAFRADFVVGCSSRAHFVFVEFEGGQRNSIFRRGTRQMRDWAPQIQHAFGQVADWTWAKNDNQHSEVYRNAFGLPHFSETYLVICGRTRFMSEIEKSRLHWRSTKTMIASSRILFWTYDDFYDQASASLDTWRDLVSGPRDGASSA